ncbi:MAG TPA: antibiotic biosynthesis monooxygenase [Asticcacaulis sp.]|nr:antibiotic biosynthesis monooxygenase [Asticcacaulis sp.]
MDTIYAPDGRAAAATQLALYVELDAKPDKIDEVIAFLESAQNLAQAEEGTVSWYALRIGETRFAIFDTFSDESDREAHLNGDVAKALMSKARDLLTDIPMIHKCEVLAAKI